MEGIRINKTHVSVSKIFGADIAGHQPTAQKGAPQFKRPYKKQIVLLAINDKAIRKLCYFASKAKKMFIHFIINVTFSINRWSSEQYHIIAVN